MLEVFPYVPLAGNVQVGVAIFSDDGRLTFGVTGDFADAPDLDVLWRGIETGTTELLDAANRSAAARPKTRPRRTPLGAG